MFWDKISPIVVDGRMPCAIAVITKEGEQMELDDQFPDGMFRFEKVIE